MLLARILFHPYRYGPRRERLNEWVYNHGPKRYRRAVITLGMERRR